MTFRALVVTIVFMGLVNTGRAEDRTQTFDADPQWDGYHNRSTAFEARTITQDFGYRTSHHAGGKVAGEIGGMITPAAEAAYYGREIPTATFGDSLSASGVLSIHGAQPVHALLGFFNSESLNEWRTPNTIALRIQGRGDVFYVYVEYATSRWRAGADTPGGFSTITDPESGRAQLVGFKTDGKPHRWSLSYDPQGNNGGGSIVATIDDETAICHLDPGHKLDGATFNHFGLLPVMKQWDSPGELWLDDITINGEAEDFSEDPLWDAAGNDRTYVSPVVRPRFDFGYSETNFVGGQPGELGGLVYRGDIREPERMAYYGDRLERLDLKKPLHAKGTMTLHRAVSDSTALLGFFHHEESARTTPSQANGFPRNFLGLAVEGPSRIGFQVYPVFRGADGESVYGRSDELPTIIPDKSVHQWAMDYTPRENQSGSLKLSFDEQSFEVEIPSDDVTRFDRFGIVSTWIDGNGQQIYFDNLTYTASQNGR